MAVSVSSKSATEMGQELLELCHSLRGEESKITQEPLKEGEEAITNLLCSVIDDFVLFDTDDFTCTFDKRFIFFVFF
jgi:hypothetical protein